MNKIASTQKLRELSVSDRMDLIEDVWATLSETPESIPVPDWHRAELDERIAAHERDPRAARPWNEVKAEILSSLCK